MSTASAVDLADAEQHAEEAHAVAETLRGRLAAGDAVTAADLDGAEREERHAQRQLDAARTRGEEQRAREAAAQLERDRAAIQAEWADYSAGEPTEVTELRQAAVSAAVDYMRAYTRHLDVGVDVSKRAEAAGLRPPEVFRRSPLPAFAKAILAECAATSAIDWNWTHPRDDRGKSSIWEVGA